MAGQNDFLIFDENKENMLTQELYKTDGDRTDGFKKGLARSNVNNKVLYQTSKMCSTIGELIKSYNKTASDSASVEELSSSLNYLFAIKQYSTDINYSENDVVISIINGEVKLYKSLINNNKNNPLNDENSWEEVKLGGGSGLEVCDIGMALYVDETKGLRRYLNGQIVDINANTQAFLNRLLQIKIANPDYFTDENTWQSEATLNIDGCVYKFVLNYADDGVTITSVRLPKYPDYVELNGGGTLPVVGNGLTLGLTNGRDNAGLGFSRGNSDFLPKATGYGASVTSQNAPNNYTGGGFYGVTTDPTKSGLETTLKQTKLKMRYFIQIATGSETENNIVNDIELNNPFSLFDSKYSDHELNNLSWLKSEGQWNSKAVYPTAYDKLLKVYNGTETVVGLSVKLSTEDYTDYDFVINTADETFMLPLRNGNEHIPDYSNGTIITSTDAFIVSSNGVVAGTIDAGIQANKSVIINGQKVESAWGGATAQDGCPFYAEVKKGDSVVVEKIATSNNYAKTTFYPFVGNGSLYYYVGETVQNANLIDAGRIGEQLASLVPNNSSLIGSYAMPSSKYIDLTLGASGATYTAPANGWFHVSKIVGVSTHTYLDLVNLTSPMAIRSNSYGSTLTASSIYIPARKGDTVKCSYNLTGETNKFRFIYAEGEI